MKDKPTPLPSLAELKQRIEQAKEPEKPEEAGPSTQNAVSLAMRLSVELVAGIVVGSVAGWFLDDWLGTSPAFVFFGFLIGCAGGFRNMKRALEPLDKEEKSGTTPRADDTTN